MQELFATTFDIAAADLDERFAEIAQEVASWAWRGDGAAPDVLAVDEGPALDHGGFRMSWRGVRLPERPERTLQVSLRHPDSENGALEWRTHADVCRGADYVSVTVRIGREATEHILAPVGLALRRPQIVPTLLGAFDCTADAIALKATPTVTRIATVESFVAGVLREPSRRLPVVVVAPDDSGDPSVDVHALASELAGLAHVYYLGSYDVWRRFPDAIGYEHRIPRGGARIYWPGFGAQDDSLRHRFWTEGAVREARPAFEASVFRMLARLSVGAVPRDPVIGVLERARSELRRKEFAAASRNSAADENALNDIVEENDDLVQTNRSLQESNETLMHENAAYRRNAADLASWESSSAERTSEPTEADSQEGFHRMVLDSWLAKLQLADRMRYPLGPYVLGREFLRSVEGLEVTTPTRIAEVCAMVACGRAPEINGFDLHALRTGPGGDDPKRTRSHDGAQAKRCALKQNTPAAPRLHFWECPGGTVEFASVGVHDDLRIPD